MANETLDISLNSLENMAWLVGLMEHLSNVVTVTGKARYIECTELTRCTVKSLHFVAHSFWWIWMGCWTLYLNATKIYIYIYNKRDDVTG